MLGLHTKKMHLYLKSVLGVFVGQRGACAAWQGEFVWHFNMKLQTRTMRGHRTPGVHVMYYSSSEKHGEGNSAGRGLNQYFSRVDALYIWHTRMVYTLGGCICKVAYSLKKWIDHSYSKHRLGGAERTCVILYAPVTVSLFHRGNWEAIMAEIPILNPTNAAVPSSRLAPPHGSTCSPFRCARTGKKVP